MSPVEILLSGATTTLAGVVTYLFRLFQTRYDKTEVELKECREDRKRLWEKLFAVENAKQ